MPSFGPHTTGRCEYLGTLSERREATIRLDWVFENPHEIDEMLSYVFEMEHEGHYIVKGGGPTHFTVLAVRATEDHPNLLWPTHKKSILDDMHRRAIEWHEREFGNGRNRDESSDIRRRHLADMMEAQIARELGPES